MHWRSGVVPLNSEDPDDDNYDNMVRVTMTVTMTTPTTTMATTTTRAMTVNDGNDDDGDDAGSSRRYPRWATAHHDTTRWFAERYNAVTTQSRVPNKGGVWRGRSCCCVVEVVLWHRCGGRHGRAEHRWARRRHCLLSDFGNALGFLQDS